MIQINSFDDLADLLQSDELTNEQVSEVVQNTMSLLLSFDEEKLPRKELVEKLREHYNKYFTQGQEYVPLFLNLELHTLK